MVTGIDEKIQLLHGVLMDFDRMETETRAARCDGYDKHTVATDSAYSLLLLTDGRDPARFNLVVAGLRHYGRPNSTSLPFVIRQGLWLEDAIAGQYALACCDCASAFIRDDVLSLCNARDFAVLFSELMTSPEFQPVEVQVVSVPPNEEGRRFLWQFLGLSVGVELPQNVRVMRKKARFMKHCAVSIGGVVMVDG